ncbi:MAG: hypothetical protein JG761_225 [Proteiniphilum sp.]|jgi:hypothetical protein|nr:hypothetical protein [Proteiniphilum sp.]
MKKIYPSEVKTNNLLTILLKPYLMNVKICLFDTFLLFLFF